MVSEAGSLACTKTTSHMFVFLFPPDYCSSRSDEVVFAREILAGSVQSAVSAGLWNV
jgi:hypothetical protein